MVLILIVVEDGLVHYFILLMKLIVNCLNPYCSGRWSRTRTHQLGIELTPCLNPYCSGRWSRT